MSTEMLRNTDEQLRAPLDGQSLVLLNQIYRNPNIATDPVFRARLKTQLDGGPEIFQEILDNPQGVTETSFRSRVMEHLAGRAREGAEAKIEQPGRAQESAPTRDPLLESAGIFLVGDNDPLVARMKAHLNVWIDQHNATTKGEQLPRYTIDCVFREEDKTALKAFQVANKVDLRVLDEPTGTGSPGPATLASLGTYTLPADQERALARMGAGSDLQEVTSISPGSSGPAVVEAKARLITFLKQNAGGPENYKNEIHISDTAELRFFAKLNELQRAHGLPERDTIGREELDALMTYQKDRQFTQDYREVISERVREVAREARRHAHSQHAEKAHAPERHAHADAEKEPVPTPQPSASSFRDGGLTGSGLPQAAEALAGLVNRGLDFAFPSAMAAEPAIKTSASSGVTPIRLRDPKEQEKAESEYRNIDRLKRRAAALWGSFSQRVMRAWADYRKPPVQQAVVVDGDTDAVD